MIARRTILPEERKSECFQYWKPSFPILLTILLLNFFYRKQSSTLQTCNQGLHQQNDWSSWERYPLVRTIPSRENDHCPQHNHTHQRTLLILFGNPSNRSIAKIKLGDCVQNTSTLHQKFTNWRSRKPQLGRSRPVQQSLGWTRGYQSLSCRQGWLG